jgi:hypothetical protein
MPAVKLPKIDSSPLLHIGNLLQNYNMFFKYLNTNPLFLTIFLLYKKNETDNFNCFANKISSFPVFSFLKIMLLRFL